MGNDDVIVPGHPKAPQVAGVINLKTGEIIPVKGITMIDIKGGIVTRYIYDNGQPRFLRDENGKPQQIASQTLKGEFAILWKADKD